MRLETGNSQAFEYLGFRNEAKILPTPRPPYFAEKIFSFAHLIPHPFLCEFLQYLNHGSSYFAKKNCKKQKMNLCEQKIQLPFSSLN